jgi:parvulin-like peptidyl-prolyl isomerase
VPASLALLLLAAAWPSRPAAGQTILVDRIVARVNDRMVTLNDFERNLADKRQAVMADPSLPDTQRQQLLDTLGRTTLAEMYEELLLLSRADQLSAKVIESDVDKALTQTKERMGLKTDQQYQQALASSGMNEEMLRDRLRRNLLVQEVMGREVQPRLKIGEEDLRR